MPFQETGRGPVDNIPVADPNDLLTPSDAARVLGLSPDSVRVLSDSGRLPAMRTVSGRRLFRRSDVDHLAAERARQSAIRAHHHAPPDGGIAPIPAEMVMSGAGNGTSNGNGHKKA